jgi:hypothetical protein
VQGQPAAVSENQLWFVPRFESAIDAMLAVLEVRVWPWLAVRSLRLHIDGQTIYEEG